MKYTIQFEYNGQDYKNIYNPIVDFSQKTITEIAYDALMFSLDFYDLEIKNNCIKNIKLFEENNDTPIYSAVTYTEGMGFLLNPEEE